jgi:hypothetical protein
MLKYLRSFQSASTEVKRFIITIAMIGLILIITTVYAYARLSSPAKGRYQQERISR